MARTFLLLPRPCGRTTVPRTIWSACFGSTPRRIANSTVSSNLANFTFCIKGTASSIVCGRSGTAALAAVNFFPAFRMYQPQWCKRSALLTSHAFSYQLSACSFQLSDYVDSHRPRGPCDRLDRRLQCLAIEIGELDLRDVLDLLL